MIPISIFIILTLGILQTGAFKILVFFPMPSYSHQRAILSLTERLVSDGHELFVISPNAVPVSIFMDKVFLYLFKLCIFKLFNKLETLKGVRMLQTPIEKKIKFEKITLSGSSYGRGYLYYL